MAKRESRTKQNWNHILQEIERNRRSANKKGEPYKPREDVKHVGQQSNHKFF